MIGGAVFSFLLLPILAWLVSRTLRAWWRRELFTIPPEDPITPKHGDNAYAGSYKTSPSVRRPDGVELGNVAAPSVVVPRSLAPPYRSVDETLSITSSRPYTLAETLSATIMSAAAVIQAHTEQEAAERARSTA